MTKQGWISFSSILQKFIKHRYVAEISKCGYVLEITNSTHSFPWYIGEGNEMSGIPNKIQHPNRPF